MRMSLYGYYLSVNRKDLAERAIAEKRRHVEYKAQKIESADRYHRELNLLSSQYKNLEEQQPGISKVNLESRLTEEAKAERREMMLERRQKLAELLAKEEQEYFIELQALAGLETKDPWNINKLKEQIEELKKQREQTEEKLRKRNICHQQINVPYVKEHKDELLGNAVKKAMEAKQKELEKETLQRREQEKLRLQELQKFHEKAIQDVEMVEQEIDENRKKWENILKEQAKTIAENDAKAEKLKLDCKQMISLCELIKSFKKKREDISQIHRETKKKIAEFRTFKDKLIRMSAEMRHNLELDLVNLHQLQQLEIKQKDIVDIVLNMSQVTAMIELIKSMLADENEHENKFYALFEEEAAKLWKERKEVWNGEQWKSRDTLMNGVFENLSLQIQEHIYSCLTSDKNFGSSRETLLEHLAADKRKMDEEERTLIDKKEYFENKVREMAVKMTKCEAVAK